MQKSFLSLITASLLMGGGTLFSGCNATSTEVEDNNTKTIVKNETLQPIEANFHGAVQKGPYLAGTVLTIHELDAQLNQTGTAYTATLKNDKGEYDFKGKLNTPIVEIYTNGYFYDEFYGENSQSTLQLSAFVDLRDKSTVNLNLLSALIKPRIKQLVEDGKTFTQAKQQAQKEALKIFHIEENNVSFETLDLSKDDEGAKILLATSLAMATTAVNGPIQIAELSEFLTKLKTDLADNGQIDDINLTHKIEYGMQNIPINYIKENLKGKYGKSVVAFEEYIDFDLDGLIQKDDDNTIDLDNKELKFTGDAASIIAGDYVALPTITIKGLKEKSTTNLLIDSTEFKYNYVLIVKNGTLVENPIIQDVVIPNQDSDSNNFAVIAVHNDDNITLKVAANTSYDGEKKVDKKMFIGTQMISYTIPAAAPATLVYLDGNASIDEGDVRSIQIGESDVKFSAVKYTAPEDLTFHYLSTFRSEEHYLKHPVKIYKDNNGKLGDLVAKSSIYRDFNFDSNTSKELTTGNDSFQRIRGDFATFSSLIHLEKDKTYWLVTEYQHEKVPSIQTLCGKDASKDSDLECVGIDNIQEIFVSNNGTDFTKQTDTSMRILFAK